MLRKSLPTLLAAPLSLLLLAPIGCSCGDDDDNGVNPDAEEGADARPDPDVPVEPTCAGEIDCPEGGEFRVEYVNWTDGGPGGRTNAARVTAFLMSNAGTGNDPDRHDLVIDPAEGQCYELVGADFWPQGQSEGREYIDAGQFIVTGGPAALTVEPGAAPPAADTWVRTHDDWGWHFGIDDAATYLSGNTAHSVKLVGSDTWPEMDFVDAAFIPPQWTLIDPPGGEGPIVFTPGEPITLTHTVEEADTELRVVNGLGIFGGGVNLVACVEFDDGEMTVPAAMIDYVLSFQSAGGMAQQAFTHNILDLPVGDEHRRIDALGVWCYVTPWVAAATVE